MSIRLNYAIFFISGFQLLGKDSWSLTQQLVNSMNWDI